MVIKGKCCLGVHCDTLKCHSTLPWKLMGDRIRSGSLGLPPTYTYASTQEEHQLMNSEYRLNIDLNL